MITTVHDITDRHALESHLVDQMFHNPLSGLVNHTLPTTVLAPSAVGKGQRMCCCTTPDAAMYLAKRAGKARIVMFDLSLCLILAWSEPSWITLRTRYSART